MKLKKKEGALEWVLELLTQYELTVYSAEQPIRPGPTEEQKRFFSGKQKNHTLKNQFIVLPFGEYIVDITVGYPEPTSDINQVRQSVDSFAPNQKLKGDKAYIGAQQIATTQKKTKNQQLSLAQIEANKNFSYQRIFVEHVIRLIKLFRVSQERFRLNRKTYEQVLMTISGLVRLRIGARLLSV